MGDFAAGLAWAAAIALLVLGRPAPAPRPAPVSYCRSIEATDVPAGEGVSGSPFAPCHMVETVRSL